VQEYCVGVQRWDRLVSRCRRAAGGQRWNQRAESDVIRWFDASTR